MNRLAFVTCMICFGFLGFGVVAQAQESDEPLSPIDAARTMKVPPGFQVTLFAGEPDVMQPVGFCIDDRGRLWVAEAYSYPERGKDAQDRIVIFEDSDGDGQHDKRTIFYEGLNYVTGVEVGFGGAWVMSPPNFYFIPDHNHDDQPDAAPQVVLDGFGNHDNAHNLANGFAWGPDGWLYGTHGRTNWSKVGVPGTPESQRVRFDGGVYRFHPITRQWEPYADGTTNPWGIDWNDLGHAFVCNCVNPHLFQVIQGAHYEPWRGRESSRYAYQRIDTIADHLHFVGLSNVRKGLGSQEEDAAGGGHAHCGTMVYLGDNFPDEYRNSFFTNNIHGRRVNNDTLRRQGSGYVASHAPDLIRSSDPWFMGVTLTYGPNGEVYVSDWSDTGECHSVRNTRRHTGRVFRVAYQKSQLPPVDLTQKSMAELVDLQLHKNDWQVRHARRLLQERWRAGEDLQAAIERLEQIFTDESDESRKLRALWCLHVLGAAKTEFLISNLDHTSENIRSWCVTLLLEGNLKALELAQSNRDQMPKSKLVTAADMSLSKELQQRLTSLAMQDQSALVRLSLASGLQRIRLSDRWELAAALASHRGDESDANLPLMIWYGCEPLIHDDLKKFAELAASAAIGRVRINIARRIAADSNSAKGLQLLSQQLSKVQNAVVASDILTGMLEGLEGRRRLTMPTDWRIAYDKLTSLNDSKLNDQLVRLALLFEDQTALKQLRQLALNTSAPAADRARAIEALASQQAAGFDADLLKLVGDKQVAGAAIRALSVFNKVGTAEAILAQYTQLSLTDRQAAMTTLAARPAWSKTLLAAMQAGRVSPSDMTAFTARQIIAHDDPQLTQQLTTSWGELKTTPLDKSKQIETIKKWLTPQVLAQADQPRGEQLYKKHCANCHTFFGEGGKIGPDITGAQRTNLDYILENIVDPNALISKDYQMEIVQTEDGRVVTGLVDLLGNDTLAIQTATERLVFPLSDIAARKKSNVSIMPQGLLEQLSEDQIRDLMGYLQREAN